MKRRGFLVGSAALPLAAKVTREAEPRPAADITPCPPEMTRWRSDPLAPLAFGFGGLVFRMNPHMDPDAIFWEDNGPKGGRYLVGSNLFDRMAADAWSVASYLIRYLNSRVPPTAPSQTPKACSR